MEEADTRTAAIAGTLSGLIKLLFMARVCEICGRGPQFGHRISHAHNVTKRRWNLNLQTVRALVNGASRRLRVCTSCIRSGKVQKVA
jgi:large subunit ribosomal protein L28